MKSKNLAHAVGKSFIIMAIIVLCTGWFIGTLMLMNTRFWGLGIASFVLFIVALMTTMFYED